MNAKLIKVLRDVREWNPVPGRRTSVKPTMLYLMQLRSHVSQVNHSRRKIVIPIKIKNGDISQSLAVKITHL